jgi:hypothetical protein
MNRIECQFIAMRELSLNDTDFDALWEQASMIPFTSPGAAVTPVTCARAGSSSEQMPPDVANTLALAGTWRWELCFVTSLSSNGRRR